MMTRRAIHLSWSQLASGDCAPATVRFDFEGIFTHGSLEGTAFAGRIDYDAATAPTDRHDSFALYEAWPGPIVTIAVGGQVLTAQGAAVYDSVFDGGQRHFDFVTLFGTGPFDGVEDAAFFEVLFADENASTLDGTGMPSAEQLAAMPVKQVAFGTQSPRNVISRGGFTLRAAS